MASIEWRYQATRAKKKRKEEIKCEKRALQTVTRRETHKYWINDAFIKLSSHHTPMQMYISITKTCNDRLGSSVFRVMYEERAKEEQGILDESFNDEIQSVTLKLKKNNYNIYANEEKKYANERYNRLIKIEFSEFLLNMGNKSWFFWRSFQK